MQPVYGWVAPTDTLEAKRLTIYMQALEYDGIVPGTRPELVVFTDGNPFADKYRKSLN